MALKVVFCFFFCCFVALAEEIEEDSESIFDFNDKNVLGLIQHPSSSEDISVEDIEAARSIQHRSLRARKLTCTIRRYENVYFYGHLLESIENVTKISNCAYLCWKRKEALDREGVRGPCTSVNFLRSSNRCELMRDSFRSMGDDEEAIRENGLMMDSQAQGNQDSVYVIPLRCGEGQGEEEQPLVSNATVSQSKPKPSSNPNQLAPQSNAEPLSNSASYSAANRRGSCGQAAVKSRMSESTERIVGGSEARPRSHPWIVSLQRGRGSHFCGGTLIRASSTDEKSDIVVTAAHCVARSSTGLQAVAGLHSLKSSSNRGESRAKVRRAIVHPNYSSRTQENDIAILLLDSPIAFSSSVQPVCLPSQGGVLAESASVHVAGWGNRKEGGSPSSNLMEVVVPIVPSKECHSNYANRMPINAQVMLCAGLQGKDSCQGDSGGPLTLRTSGGSVLHGVVSFGEGCARARRPGVYTRVSSFANWINEQVRSYSSLKKH